MPENTKETSLRRYLLGELLGDEETLSSIERRRLGDDDFEEEIAIEAEELIDDYVDDKLDSDERLRFETHFLQSPEYREKLDFARLFKSHLSEKNKEEKADAPAQNLLFQPAPKKRRFFDWRPAFTPALAMASLAVVLLAGVIFGLWSNSQRQSDLDKGLIALHRAFENKRPFESRISGFNHAPLINTRGGEKDASQTDIQLAVAERFLLDAAVENSNAQTLAALGKFYLAKKDFEKSVEYFEKSVELNAADAQLHSDFGAALLEMGKRAHAQSDGAKSLEAFDKSLLHLEKAVKLDPKLLEARFNRAMCFEAVFSMNQAKEAWREYLQLDSSSPWADEARKHLEKLESQKQEDYSATELENAFLAAFRNENEGEAWRLLSANRELIKEKYLPQRLAMLLVEGDDGKKKDFFEALIYVGELEKSRINDSFAADLADYYAKAPPDDLEILKQAQAAVRQGYKLLLAGKFSRALEEFTSARDLFLRVNNVWEAKLSEYQIVYCFYNTDQKKRSLVLAQEIADFCERKNYKWLQSIVLYWLAYSQKNTGEALSAKDNFKKCLALAEEINDPHILQLILVSFAKQNNFVGQKQSALNYLQRVFEKASAPGISLRQKWRNYSGGIEILTNVKLVNLAKAASAENIELAKKLNDSLYVIYSQINAGIVRTQTQDFDEAERLLNEARKNAELVGEETERKSLLAKSFLNFGHLEKKQNNFAQAARFYEQALSLVENANTPPFLYEIQKARLLAYLSLNNDAELEKQIPATLQLTEQYRAQILEEQERSSFFDNEQNIYDIAVANEFKKTRYEQAYNYLETSNSRSLLDWLEKGAVVQTEKKKLDIIFHESARPLALNEIRALMPENAQILQYAVLEDRVLIWLVSKQNFAVVASDVDSARLNEKVDDYIRLLTAHNAAKQAETQRASRELYDLLVAPVAARLEANKEIALIPHKTLFKLPFAALVAPDGTPFLAQHSFLYAPSANVFLHCTKAAREKSSVGEPEHLLSVGNPAFDRSAFEDLPDLPAAEDEAREIARFYEKSQTLFGRQATKTAFQTELKSAQIIHFAGHYVVQPNAPLFSSLLLAKTGKGEVEKSVLTNADLTTEKLARAKLVVLSACQTGVEQYYNGEGLIGLSRTFLVAGAPLVVASQWKVDSDAAAEMMKKFHFYRREANLSSVAALRRAQLEMLNAPDERFRHPYFWASFAAFGGYAEF
jgi:CHAT domain-containing protein/tetratricopeptide (TPR) repeat protein